MADTGGMNIAGAATQGGMGSTQIAMGIYQMSQAKKYARHKRPEYKIPDALQTYLLNARQRANTYGLPGQGALENKINAQSGIGTQTLMQSQQSPASIAAGVAALDQNSKGAMAQLGVEGARFKAGQQGAQDNALQMMAAEQKKQWEWDRQSPYLNAMAAAAALNGAGMQNIQGGMNQVAQSGSTLAGGGGGGSQQTMKSDGGQYASFGAPMQGGAGSPNYNNWGDGGENGNYYNNFG